MFAGQTSARAADPVLAAVGDIACQPGDTANACEQSVTAQLVATHAPTAVAVLGDNQYASGLFSEFEGKGAYNATWGQFNPIVHPVPGNHEYSASSTAHGYFKYFGPAAVGPNGAGAEGPNGSYSYDLGSWHLIALNSDCSNTGCSDSVTGTTSDAQVSWLNSDLAAHPGQCTLAYWHHPRFSASFSGDTPGVAPLWNALYAAHAAGVQWSAGDELQAGIVLCCGVVLLYAVWFAIMTCSFWLVQVNNLDVLFFAVFEAARYPVGYFRGAMRALLTFVVPVAFATTFPTDALLGRVDPRLVPLGLGLAALSLVATHRFWNLAVRSYSSASS